MIPLYGSFANFIVRNIIPDNLSFYEKKNFLHDATRYFWDEPYLFTHCSKNIILRCIPEIDMKYILEPCHTSQVGGHYAGYHNYQKVLQSGYYLPSLQKDVYHIRKKCDQCQKQGSISKHHEIPMNKMVEVELINV